MVESSGYQSNLRQVYSFSLQPLRQKFMNRLLGRDTELSAQTVSGRLYTANLPECDRGNLFGRKAYIQQSAKPFLPLSNAGRYLIQRIIERRMYLLEVEAKLLPVIASFMVFQLLKYLAQALLMQFIARIYFE